MDYFIICLAAFIGSLLTFFSGFGLGTLLVPVFGIFFPIEMAILMTAVVHFLNNLFKLLLTGRHADVKVLLRFGLPSMIAAVAGAWLLSQITVMEPLFKYEFIGGLFFVEPVKLVIAVMLILFSIVEMLPDSKVFSFRPDMLPVGGLLSGFFGGLSGHQGALRSAFLIKLNLKKEVFIATGVAIACLVDVSRLSVYLLNIPSRHTNMDYQILVAAVASAFAGAYIGRQFLHKMTLSSIHFFVAVMLIIFAILLGAGII